MCTYRGWFQVSVSQKPVSNPLTLWEPLSGLCACPPPHSGHHPHTPAPPPAALAPLAPFAGPFLVPPCLAGYVVHGHVPGSQPVHSDAIAISGAARDCAALARPRLPCRGRKPDLERRRRHLPSSRGRHGAQQRQGECVSLEQGCVRQQWPLPWGFLARKVCSSSRACNMSGECNGSTGPPSPPLPQPPASCNSSGLCRCPCWVRCWAPLCLRPAGSASCPRCDPDAQTCLSLSK